MITLKEDDIRFSGLSVVDPAGRVFFHQDRVLRAVFSEESARQFIGILNAPWIEELFEQGLVRTWVCKDIEIPGVPLVLEHQKFPYELHPSEQTSFMFWLSTKKIVGISAKLGKYGYGLKDGHPWNLMFYKGSPYYIDFGSIVKTDSVSRHWAEEFRRYFGAPVWLASKKRLKGLAREYRRQHLVGFGLEVFDSVVFKKFGLRSLNKALKYLNDPCALFMSLDGWLNKHRPFSAGREYWASYNQSHETGDTLSPTTVKQKFVHEVLTEENPKSVLDCAANKGFYSEMAARLGAEVAAFDYEEFCVDFCLNLARSRNLNITPAVMDFKLPTPGYGMGLCGGTAFDRFQSEIVLALGLAHHLCINQNLPVKTFCDIVLKYAKRGVVFEYVDPSDKHVTSWKRQTPADYSLEHFIRCFSGKFKVVKTRQMFTEDGIRRTFVYLRALPSKLAERE